MEGNETLMAIEGLTLPFLSDADPDLLAEGSIDPMGLAPVSDRLAEHLVPNVTARMSRIGIRFVTVIAACSLVCNELHDLPPADDLTPPYLAAEWNILEGFARRLQGSDASNIAGIVKARQTIVRGGRLDHRSYLKAAKVFGFHGVYKRLARSFDLVDAEMFPGAAVDQLLRLWEREQGMDGFVDEAPRSIGAAFRMGLRSATAEALLVGKVTLPPSSGLFGRATSTFRPDRSGRGEDRWLWESLLSDVYPTRRELVLALKPLRHDASEREALNTVRKHASPELRVQIDAINAFEDFGVTLAKAFDVLRFASMGEGWLDPASMLKSGLIQAAAKTARSAEVRAAEEIDKLDTDLAALFDRTFGGFSSATGATSFLETLLEHHERVQREKGNRSWYERSPQGLMIHPKFGIEQEPVLVPEYGRPYRIRALFSFARDVA